eukprot:CAMPEP_0181313228 /NCGR_PEP_ID=MMETSP1101-20121128/14135_1 /TAXON_ID=46948 /ORGANISM="Rhodomonas abbreviata, Strain Caron Lab Isolate" /LENGTH=100 /DNA_ID=CAMNT_0023420165 /DNA_START=75 /DNA_END=377 /DNA_ORIENTATION=-
MASSFDFGKPERTKSSTLRHYPAVGVGRTQSAVAHSDPIAIKVRRKSREFQLAPVSPTAPNSPPSSFGGSFGGSFSGLDKFLSTSASGRLQTPAQVFSML